MERGHKYQDGVRYFESEKRLEGARGKTGRYSPENNSSLPFRHIIPRRGIVRSALRYASTEKRISVQRNWKDKRIG